jgi:hypothetical protein
MIFCRASFLHRWQHRGDCNLCSPRTTTVELRGEGGTTQPVSLARAKEVLGGKQSRKKQSTNSSSSNNNFVPPSTNFTCNRNCSYVAPLPTPPNTSNRAYRNGLQGGSVWESYPYAHAGGTLPFAAAAHSRCYCCSGISNCSIYAVEGQEVSS